MMLQLEISPYRVPDRQKKCPIENAKLGLIAMTFHQLRYTVIKGAIAIALVAMVTVSAVSTAAADPANPRSIPAECDGVAQSLVTHRSIQEAVKADRSTFIGFTCLDDVITVEARAKGSGRDGEATSTVVQQGASGRPVDLTGLTQEERDEKAPSIVLGPEAISSEPLPSSEGGSGFSTLSTTINHSYRASSNDTVYWGQRTSAGVLLWYSSARVTSWISLQNTYHQFNVTYTSLGGRLIDMTIPVRMREHFQWWPDGTVDTRSYSPWYYGTYFTETSYLRTPDAAGKFYPELYNMSLQDRAAGRSFSIGGTIQYPRFQCYWTVNCKYPNGAEAPW